ncbi:3816_t:CDS:2, partial [Gigaspora margarita]
NKITNKEILEATEIGILEMEIETEEINIFNNFELVEAIRSMTKILHNREVKESKSPLFLEQLYLAACPSDHSSQTMECMKKIMVFICYFLASLNNTQINAFKSDLAFYLDSAGTSNEGLNTNAFKNALLLNIDDYHNIHIQQQLCTTATSLPTHVPTIIANLCLTLAISHNQVLNPKIVDGELIIKNIDKCFIVNFGVLYYNYMKNCINREHTDTELLEKLTLHSYNDKLLAEKKSEQHIKNFPVVADWPGQFYIHKAIVQKVLLNNQNIPEFVVAFLSMMGPLHILWNGHKLVFKKNLCLLNDIYKSIFGIRKNLALMGEQLQIAAHTTYQQCHNYNFQQQFVQSEKYPYSPKQLCMLSQKCTIYLLGLFTKIYHTYDISSFIVSSSNNIAIYKLSSLGYEIMNCHFPRGFVISRKPSIFALCNSIYCNISYDLSNSSVLAYRHGYHSYCLQNQQFKCFICLDYLQNKIRKNTNVLIKSLTKDLDEKLSKEDIEEDKNDD